MLSRRNFLYGTTSAVAIAATTPAGAYFPHGNPAPSGRSLIGVDNAVGLFKNLALQCSWALQNTDYAIFTDYPKYLDNNGWPNNPLGSGGTQPNYVGYSLYFPSNITSSTSMTLRFTGTGKIQLNMSNANLVQVSGSTGGSSGSTIFLSGTSVAECTFTLNTPQQANPGFYLLAAANTFSGFGNLVFCQTADRNSIVNATKPEDYWSDPYVTGSSGYRTLNPRVLRYLGLTSANFGNVSQTKYIIPWNGGGSFLSNDGSGTIGGCRFPPGAWAGTATNSTVTTTTTISCSSQPDATGSYVEGEMIQCAVTAASNTTLLFNCGSRGAKSILTTAQGLVITSVGTSLATFTYDSVMDCFYYAKGGQTSWVPYEIQVGLCNRVNANGWFQFPSYIDNPSVTAVGNMIKANLNGQLSAYFEYGNEWWNGKFTQFQWAGQRGFKMGFTTNQWEPGYVGLRCRMIHQILSSLWSPRAASTLKRVISFQGAGDPNGTQTYIFNGSDLVAGNSSFNAYVSAFNTYTGTAVTSFNSSPNRPIDYCDVISYATYWSGAQCSNFGYSAVQTPKAVTAGTNNATVQITVASHGFSTGQRVYFGYNAYSQAGTDFTGGWAALNGQFQTATVVDANNFTVPVNSAGFGAFTSGTVARMFDEFS